MKFWVLITCNKFNFAECQLLLCDFQNVSDTVALIQKFGNKSNSRIAALLVEVNKFQLEVARRQGEIVGFQAQSELSDKDKNKLLHMFNKI